MLEKHFIAKHCDFSAKGTWMCNIDSQSGMTGALGSIAHFFVVSFLHDVCFQY